MEFETKNQVLDTLNDLHPAEAARMLPFVQQQHADRMKTSADAQAEVASRKAVCDENDAVRRFITGLVSQKTAELHELIATLRTELYALRETFALGEQAPRVRALKDEVSYLDAELDHLVGVKRGADEILFLDALESLALAKSVEAHSAALLSHVQTVAALGPAYEEEGVLGVIGMRTMRLQDEAALADKRHEAAKIGAREARMAYERQQSARVSRGFVTSANTGHAIGH